MKALFFLYLEKTKQNEEQKKLKEKLSKKNYDSMMLELAKANLLDENGNIRKDLTPEEKAKLNEIIGKYDKKEMEEQDKKDKKDKEDKEDKEDTEDTEDNKKEVYNISENIFTYDQAKNVCKKYNGKLATYAQLEKAHKKGANWCNYGWSRGQMALYPIQQEYYDEK